MGRFRWHRVRTVMRGSTIRIKPLRYEEEYTKTPQYPPILDTSYKARTLRKFSEWYEEIKSLDTVEEKLMKINMPKYYGWHSSILKEGSIPYNMLPLAQYITRTHLLEFKDLPKRNLENEADKLLEQIKPQLEEALVFEYKYRSRKYQHAATEEGPVSVSELDDIMGKSVVQQFNRILLANLSNQFPHLLNCQIEANPRVETFWLAGWENPPKSYLTILKPWIKEFAEESPYNRWIQYFGSPVLHVRHELPLPVIVDQKLESNDYEIPNFQYDPKVLGVQTERLVGTNIPDTANGEKWHKFKLKGIRCQNIIFVPSILLKINSLTKKGFWPGDPCEFGLLSYHNRGYLLKRPKTFGNEDNAEALKVQAILASFGWLHPQACYQGFSTYNDVTYPLVTQTVITNGKLWSFYIYQLNTTLLHSEHALNNPRCNLCWATPELKLFEEITDGKVVGFNDEVLKNLLMLYLNSPRVREGVELKPYLGKEVKHIADITDDKKRVWLENTFKHMYSGRPRHRLLPEIYDWEKIYKIRHKTRPHEARRRPFELRIDPYRRRYDEHVPKYIPKKLRAETQPKKKFEDTYYP